MSQIPVQLTHGESDRERAGLADLVDLDGFRCMMDAFHQATGYPYGLVDRNNQVLAGAGWQDICLLFHRQHPDTLQQCVHNNQQLIENLQHCDGVGQACKNGLNDFAVRITIDGHYAGSLYLGQFAHEPPDPQRFRDQAHKFGFDEQAYLEALARVPVIPRDQTRQVMAYYGQIARMLEREANACLKAQRLTDSVDEQGRRCSALIDSTPLLVWLTNADGLCIYSNRRWLEWTGRESTHVLGRRWLEDIHPDHRPAFEQCLGEAVARKQPFSMLLQLKMADGEYGWIDQRVGPHLGPHGAFLGLIGSAVDIRKDHLAQRRLEHAEQRLAHQETHADAMTRGLMRELSATLGTVSSLARMIEQKLGEANQAKLTGLNEHIHQVVAQSHERLLPLRKTEQLLAEPPNVQTVNLHQLLSELLDELKPLIESRQAQIDLARNLPTLIVDPVRLTEAMRPLLHNAIVHGGGDDSPHNHVGWQQTNQVRLFVRDEGPGIAVEDHQRIALPFQKACDDPDRAGLGLTIAHRIAEAMQGSVAVASAPGQGATFSLNLPLFMLTGGRQADQSVAA